MKKMQPQLAAIEDTAAEYTRLSIQVGKLEVRRKELSEVLKLAAVDFGGTVEAGAYQVTAIAYETERFDKEAALAKLGLKMLKPFLSYSKSTRLQVKATGVEK